MAQHFLLSAAARTLPLKTIYVEGDEAAYHRFCRLRWPKTQGRPICVTFGAVDMDSIEKAVRVRVVDALEVESSCKLIPVRGLVGDDLAALGNLRSGETHALGFVLHDTCHRATVALTQGDDAAPVTCPMFLEAPIDATRQYVVN